MPLPLSNDLNFDSLINQYNNSLQGFLNLNVNSSDFQKNKRTLDIENQILSILTKPMNDVALFLNWFMPNYATTNWLNITTNLAIRNDLEAINQKRKELNLNLSHRITQQLEQLDSIYYSQRNWTLLDKAKVAASIASPLLVAYNYFSNPTTILTDPSNLENTMNVAKAAASLITRRIGPY